MLIIGGVVAAFAVFNGVYPAVQRGSEAINSAADTLDERIKSQIEIIQVGQSGTTVDAWVKNVGSSDIAAIENGDVFFGPVGNFTRIAYGNGSTPLPYWTYQLEGSNTRWGQTVTNRLTVHLSSSPLPGTYLLKIVIPNGVFDETTFSVE